MSLALLFLFFQVVVIVVDFVVDDFVVDFVDGNGDIHGCVIFLCWCQGIWGFINMLSGEIRTNITINVKEQAGNIILEITDEGPGIPEFANERIFERFYSLPRPETGQKSSGLGLNFAREVAQLHGGSLVLENLVLENGQSGARARLKLPINSA